MGATVLQMLVDHASEWDREADKEERNTIVHSFNRNFSKELTGTPIRWLCGFARTSYCFSHSRRFKNPLTDTLINENGDEVKLDAPSGDELPPKKDVEDPGFQAPAADGSGIQVSVSDTSERLQLLAPFLPWDGKNILGARVLIKAFGKCTTDHISMAGPWLRFRGHLDNISNNMLIGAINAFNQKTNSVKIN
jgi:aconitate hydratase